MVVMLPADNARVMQDDEVQERVQYIVVERSGKGDVGIMKEVLHGGPRKYAKLVTKFRKQNALILC